MAQLGVSLSLSSEKMLDIQRLQHTYPTGPSALLSINPLNWKITKSF